MEPKKLTKQEFADKYGYDPRTRTSTQAPTPGAVGGSNVSTGKQYAGTISPEEFAKISGGSSQQGRISAADFANMSGEPAPKSDFKPGKLVQAMEDYRPDYIEKGQGSGENGKRTFGDIYNNISEGLFDVGVGAVKGAIRMPVNIAQALTPDAMWGENSLLNSDSERAQAFASATKGKTGLQKIGATGIDVASLFNPFSAEATIGGLAARGGGKLAQLATRGIDIAAENPSLVQKGAGLFQKVLPSIADSVVSGAVVGKGGDNVGTDTLMGAAFPTAKFAYKEIGDILGKPIAKSIIASVKDSVFGGRAATDAVLNEMTNFVKTTGKEGIEAQAKQMVTNRGVFSKMLQTFKGNWFGYGSKADSTFNDAADLISTRYMPHAESAGDMVDLTKSHDLLQSDKVDVGNMLADAKSVFANAKTPAKSVKQSFYATMQSTGVNTTTDAYRGIRDYVIKRIDTLAEMRGGHLTASDIDGIRHDIGVQMGKLADTEGTLLGMYKQAYKSFASQVEKSGIKAGQNKAVDLYKKTNQQYGTLLDAEAMMQRISKMKSNPFGLSWTEKRATQLGLGAGMGAITGNLGAGGLTFFAAKPLTELLSHTIAKAKIYTMKTDPLMNAINEARTSSLNVDKQSLKELIAKQAKK